MGWSSSSCAGAAGASKSCLLYTSGSVLDAVRALPENYRNAVYLHYYEGYTAAEVGRMLGADVYKRQGLSPRGLIRLVLP